MLLIKYECRWLAYAVSHPRTNKSSWTGLRLRYNNAGDDVVRAFTYIQEDPLRAQSIGHLADLASVVPTSEVQGDWLIIATVRREIAILARPDDDAVPAVLVVGVSRQAWLRVSAVELRPAMS